MRTAICGAGHLASFCRLARVACIGRLCQPHRHVTNRMKSCRKFACASRAALVQRCASFTLDHGESSAKGTCFAKLDASHVHGQHGDMNIHVSYRTGGCFAAQGFYLLRLKLPHFGAPMEIPVQYIRASDYYLHPTPAEVVPLSFCPIVS